MALDLRKGIALGPGGIDPVSIYSYPNQKVHLTDTRTRWVRFWADWSELQPSRSNAFDNPKWFDLDAQIRQAISDQYFVMLTAYRCPLWANANNRSEVADSGIGLDTEHQKFVVPDDIYVYDSQGARTPWSLFIEHLTIRYNPANPANQGAFVHCVEVINEPNVQMQPLWHTPKADRRPRIPAMAARMMRTAWAAKNGTAPDAAKEFWPVLVGPATGDTDETSDFRMPYDMFTQELIAELQRIGFAQPGGWYAWSHHNHRDIETNGGGVGPTGAYQINRAKRARDLIKGKWRGWGSNDVNDPRIFLTEGGARIDQLKREWFGNPGQLSYTPERGRAKQAELLQNQATRMKTGSEGVGMSMMMQYLITSSIGYDTGLVDAYTYDSEASFV